MCLFFLFLTHRELKARREAAETKRAQLVIQQAKLAAELVDIDKATQEGGGAFVSLTPQSEEFWVGSARFWTVRQRCSVGSTEKAAIWRTEEAGCRFAVCHLELVRSSEWWTQAARRLLSFWRRRSGRLSTSWGEPSSSASRSLSSRRSFRELEKMR